MLTKHQLLSSPRFAEVDCPAAGGTLRIKRLRAGELLGLGGAADPAAGQFALVAACLLNGDETPMFTPAELRDLDGPLYLAISKLVADVNGLGEGAAEKKQPIPPSASA